MINTPGPGTRVTFISVGKITDKSVVMSDYKLKEDEVWVDIDGRCSVMNISVLNWHGKERMFEK